MLDKTEILCTSKDKKFDDIDLTDFPIDLQRVFWDMDVILYKDEGLTKMLKRRI